MKIMLGDDLSALNSSVEPALWNANSFSHLEGSCANFRGNHYLASLRGITLTYSKLS